MKKKKTGCLIIVLILVGAFIFGVTRMMKNPEKYQAENQKSDENMIFDATKFYVDEDRTVSEAELIDILGEPDNIEEWKYETVTKSYSIRTLSYGNYEYHFNTDMLQRISINEEISYKSKNEILQMFGLKKYKNSKVTDTNFAYRVTNCGVNDFWVASMTDGSMSAIRISYGTLFTD